MTATGLKDASTVGEGIVVGAVDAMASVAARREGPRVELDPGFDVGMAYAPSPPGDETGMGDDSESPSRACADSGEPEDPVVSVPAAPSSNRRFQPLQRWIGTVLSVADESFIARLADVSDPFAADEEAEFPVEEISPADRPLISPGAMFYWNVGYADSGGTRARKSVIRFRRLPVWGADELAAAAARAAARRRILNG